MPSLSITVIVLPVHCGAWNDALAVMKKPMKRRKGIATVIVSHPAAARIPHLYTKHANEGMYFSKNWKKTAHHCCSQILGRPNRTLQEVRKCRFCHAMTKGRPELTFGKVAWPGEKARNNLRQHDTATAATVLSSVFSMICLFRPPFATHHRLCSAAGLLDRVKPTLAALHSLEDPLIPSGVHKSNKNLLDNKIL